LLVVLFIINTCYAQDDWKVYKIDDKLSIKFPSPPRRSGDGSLMSVDKDSSAYIVMVSDLGDNVRNADSAKVASIFNNPAAANQLKAMIQEKMSGFTMNDCKKIDWHGFPCFQIDGAEPIHHTKFYCKMLVINGNLYFIGTALPGNRDEKVKDDFLNSLALN